MAYRIGQTVLSEEQIRERILQLGQQITNDYKGQRITAVCILKGASVFLADLSRAVGVPVEFDFMAVSSYGRSTHTSGEVRILKDLDESLEGKHVLVVEDIIDTGLTLKYLIEILKSRGPASLKVCCMLDKPERRLAAVKVDYCGFQIPDLFVIGYGLDYAGLYRNLPYVAVLEGSEDRQKTDTPGRG